jgi:hypothetical protein
MCTIRDKKLHHVVCFFVPMFVGTCYFHLQADGIGSGGCRTSSITLKMEAVCSFQTVEQRANCRLQELKRQPWFKHHSLWKLLNLQPSYICCTYFALLPKSSAVVISGMCQVDVGENCIVKDKQYGNMFDLKVLHSTDRDYILTTEHGDHYDINVCGQLNRTCNGQAASVCLTKQDRQSYAIGEI